MFTWQKSRNANVGVLLLLLVLFLNACGSVDTPTVQAIPEAQASPTIDQPVPKAPEGSPFTRRDVPPSGVEALLELPSIPSSLTDSPCLESFANYKEPEPALKLYGCSVIADFCTICFLRFEPNQVIELYIDGPEGLVVEQFPVHPDNSGNAQWVGRIDPISYVSGEYTVHTVQAKTMLATKATFTVKEPTEPRILVMTSKPLSPGQPFRIILAGFRPGELVPLYLYQNVGIGGEGWVYLTSLPPAQMNERGQDPLYIVYPQPGDPEGLYMVVTPLINYTNYPSNYFDATFNLGD